MARETLLKLLKDVPDFPKPGIVYKDITPVLEDPAAFAEMVDAMKDCWARHGINRIVGVESRGFIFGAALAYAMGIGLTLVRKPGKLPRETRSVTYALEYGTDTLEIHDDSLKHGDRVLVVDDVLATGGTAAGVAELIAGCGADVVGYTFVLELGFLGGRDKLDGVTVQSLLVLE